MLGCCLGKIDQFLSDDIVKGRLEPKTSSDRLSCLALLDPDFVRFAGIHRPTLLRSALRDISVPATRLASTNAAAPRRCAPRWRRPSSAQPERQASCRA